MIKTMRSMITEALDEEMANDPTVFLIGEDIAEYGGTLQLTVGLYEKYGEERVIDTPISESALTGLCVGAAMMGMKPVLELMFADFLPIAADQLVNNAAKMCYAYNGDMMVPMVVRAPFGAGSRSGMHHSQNLENWFVNVPGIKVVMPSNAYDAKGLLKASIRDPNPVIFLEHKMLLGTRSEIPEEEYVVELGKADIKRTGTDVTLLSWGAMVNKCLEAAEKLNPDISCEVVDLRTLSPLDTETIVESVKKTSRLVVVHEAPLTGGLGGEIVALVADKAFGYLDAPLKRVGGPDTPVPFSPPLEDAYIPSVQSIIDVVKGLI